MALNITVITGPSGNISLGKEFDLLKSALLYGDEVTLCSPTVWMMQALAPLDNMTVDGMFELVNFILPAYPQAATGITPQMLSTVTQYAKTLFKKRGLSTPENVIKQQILHAYKQVIRNFQDFNSNSGNAQLHQLVKSGNVKLHQFSSSDTNSIVEEYMTFAAGAVADGRAFPLFDDASGDLVKAIEKEKGGTSEVDSKRIKHVHLADNLFQMLPDLSSATLDEVVDIRRELNKYLLNFRAKIVEMSDSIKSAVWDKDFPKEVQQLKIAKIDPAISEIAEHLKTTTALKDFITKPKDLLTGVGFSSTVGVIISNFAHLDAFAMAALGATVVAGAGALQKIIESKSVAKKNQLYFYYRLNQELQ